MKEEKQSKTGVGKDKELWTDTEVSRIHSQLAREKEEPSEGFSPIPIVFLFLCSALIFWGGVYIALPQHSAGFSADYFSHLEYTVRGQERDAGPIAAAVTPPERLYARNCAACHQAGGQGVPGNFPTLHGTEWVLGGEERLVRVVMHGLQGPITVRGNEYNGVMQGFANQLNDDEMARLLSWIRSQWGNDAPPIEEETVARIREATAGRREAWTQPELVPYE